MLERQTGLHNRIAVITGAASGFGLEFALMAAREGMRVVMADVDDAALRAAGERVRGLGAAVVTHRVDVSRPEQVQALADVALARFGVPHLLFNNAGVSAGGLIWEHNLTDWQWVLGVNLMGVVHGIRVFTPLMLERARSEADYRGHIINTASMAGLLNAPNMGAYNVSKHAVVSLSETLYQDLALVTTQVSASVLCPFYVPTGIARSERLRPGDHGADVATPTNSQQIAKAMLDKAVERGTVTAAEVALRVFDAVRERRFYIYSHPRGLELVQARLDEVVQGRNPGDPFSSRPEVGERLRAALR